MKKTACTFFMKIIAFLIFVYDFARYRTMSVSDTSQCIRTRSKRDHMDFHALRKLGLGKTFGSWPLAQKKHFSGLLVLGNSNVL